MHYKEVSICIPFYNGYETTKLILDELCDSNNLIYEIIISDDNSKDIESYNLKNYIDTYYLNSNVKLYRNLNNLGMDLNFQKCIELSTSKYTWFMGQDDFIYKDKLMKVISLLSEYKPDIVYLNYEVQRTWNYSKNFIHTDNLNIESGNNIDDFHRSTRGNLPHFLPSLLVKTSLWPNPSIMSLYNETYFAQLGAFLHILATHSNWLYIGEPMSIGSIPDDGWQSSVEKKIKIYAGFMKCIKISYSLYPNLKNIFQFQYNKNSYQHLSLSIEGKLCRNNELITILKSKNIFTSNYILITNIIQYTPNLFLNLFVKTRKLYFKLTHFKNTFKSINT